MQMAMWITFYLLCAGNIINRNQHRSQKNSHTDTETNYHGRLYEVYESVHSSCHLASIELGKSFQNTSQLSRLLAHFHHLYHNTRNLPISRQSFGNRFTSFYRVYSFGKYSVINSIIYNRRSKLQSAYHGNAGY